MMEKEFAEAKIRIDEFIERRYKEYKTQEYIKQCIDLGIFPMHTEGVLCDELNRLGSAIRHQDKFGELERIREIYGW